MEIKIGNSVILNKYQLRKFINTLMFNHNTMGNNELIEVSFIGNTVLVESEDSTTIVKLD